LNPSIILPGQNCRTVEVAEHLSFLVDGDEYFSEIARAFQCAQREILIVGWDFDPRISLTPDQDDGNRLDSILKHQLEKEPNLFIRILVWAMGPLYSGKSLRLFRRQGLLSHRRVRIEFDSRHPLSSSHHQKMVIIDDAIAFIGGIDLTARRWDDSRHLPCNPLRVTPDGQAYEPVHDMHVMIDGPAARRVGDLCRRRWKRATGETTPTSLSPLQTVTWPCHRKADLVDCRVALSVTEPKLGKQFAVRQSTQLARDAIVRARRHIYIEAQYLASFKFADVLAERLADPDCPEIVMVVTRISHGFLEKVVMGNNRDRIIRRLKRADMNDRLWVMYAAVPDVDGNAHEVLIHSKLLIVDNDFVRIGSSNLNNRSEGFDTEADISVEACDVVEHGAIASLRNRLLAEHVDASRDDISETYKATGSLMATIVAHNVNSRGLRHFDIDVNHGATEPILGTSLVDPARPLRPFAFLKALAYRAWSRLTRFLLQRTRRQPRELHYGEQKKTQR
jgi:phospholipase D1/2